MEAQAQRAEFWTDLASAARALVSQLSVPLVSVAVMLFPGVLVLSPLHHSVALSVIDFASAIFLLGWYGAERVFFLRHLEGKPVTLRHLLELVKPFMGRFFAVGLLFGIVMLIPMRVVAAFGLHRPHGAPLSASFWVSFGVVLVIMDFALTFVTPALAYTTRSAVRALRIGFGMIRQTWPRCALYVLCPPLALNILHVLHPVSHLGMQLALSAALAFVGLVAKGAIAAFYLRERGSYSDDGAAYITGGELAVTLRGMLATAVALVLSLLAAGMGFLAFALLFFPYHYAGQLPKSGDVEAAILLLIGGCVGGALAYLIKRKG